MLLSARSLYLLFTPSRCRHDPWQTLADVLAAGVDLVQWRIEAAPSSGDADNFERCRRLCRNAGVPLIVNDDVMLAVRQRTAGAHVGQADMAAGAARRVLGNAGVLGVSTHSVPQITAAIAAGADYVGFGPCYPTATKGYETGLGAMAIGAAVDAAGRLPLFAIGGITADNLPALRGLGVDRIAVCSAILDSDDPAAAAARLRRML